MVGVATLLSVVAIHGCSVTRVPEGSDDLVLDSAGCGADTASELLPLFHGMNWTADGLPVEVPEDFAVSIRQTPCFGTCPGYSLRLGAAGDILYHGGRWTRVQGEVRSQVDQSTVKETMQLLRDGRFGSYFSDYYGVERCSGPEWSDASSSVIEVELLGRRHRVSVNDLCVFCRADEFHNLFRDVGELLGTEEWVRSGDCVDSGCDVVDSSMQMDAP